MLPFCCSHSASLPLTSEKSPLNLSLWAYICFFPETLSATGAHLFSWVQPNGEYCSLAVIEHDLVCFVLKALGIVLIWFPTVHTHVLLLPAPNPTAYGAEPSSVYITRCTASWLCLWANIHTPLFGHHKCVYHFYLSWVFPVLLVLADF